MANRSSRRNPPEHFILQSLEQRRLMSGYSCLIPGAQSSHTTTTQPTVQVTQNTSNVSPAITSAVSNLISSLPALFCGSGTILFSQAPAAVQTGLNTLATTDGLTPPTAGQTVFLGNANGIESYSVVLTGTGTVSRLTVDVNGNPVTAPTKTTTDWTTFSAANPTAAAEISAIAAALNLTAPTGTTKVCVVTTNGNSTFSVNLSSATSGGRHGWFNRTTTITVDAAGNPVGDDLKIPFNILPTAIQTGLIAHEPAGVTLDPTSTQTVFVDTFDGIPTYTMTFNSLGTTTTVTVDKTGTPVSLPGHSTTTFGTLLPAVQSELQLLATADGVAGTIDPAQNVVVNSETTGTSVYSVRLTTSSNKHITISVDQAGNPTVPPMNDDGFGSFFGFFH